MATDLVNPVLKALCLSLSLSLSVALGDVSPQRLRVPGHAGAAQAAGWVLACQHHSADSLVCNGLVVFSFGTSVLGLMMDSGLFLSKPLL